MVEENNKKEEETIKILNSAQLYQPEFQKNLIEKVDEIILYLDDKQAKFLAGNLEKILSGFDGDLETKQIYDDLIVKLKFVALPRLDFKEIVALFKNGLIQALRDETLPVLERLRLSLTSINPWARDDFKSDLITALRDNQEILFWETSEQGEREIKVAECLENYNHDLGIELVSKIKQTEYFVRHFSKIEREDRDLIRKLFDIYEYLKITSESPQGFEDDFTFATDEGQIQIIEGNRLVNVRPSEKRRLTAEEAEYLRQNVLPEIKDPQERKTFIEEAGLAEILSQERIEAEVEIEKKRLSTALPLIDMSQAVERITADSGLNFSEPARKKRFQGVAESFLRDVRGEIETRIVLKREPQIGGLGLDNETVDKLIKVLKEQKPRVRVPTTQVSEEDIKKEVFQKSKQRADIKKTIESSSAILNQDLISAQTRMKGKKEKFIEVRPPKEETKEVESQKKTRPPIIEVSLPEKKIIPSQEVRPLEKPLEKIVPSMEVRPPREKIEDIGPQKSQKEIGPQEEPETQQEITIRSKVYGPADELRTLTLADWRRWGAPQQAAARIQDKISLLAEESLLKKAEAIKAWKESEINRLYLKIGEESINNGISVKEVIAKRQQQGQPTLSEEEFDLVVGLNENLRF